MIALDAAHVYADDVSVYGHHYEVGFDTAGGEPETIAPVIVFAESFEAGFRDFPADPVWLNRGFVEWNTEDDGSGERIEAETVLAEEPLAEGEAVQVALTAQYGAEAALETDLADDEALGFVAGASPVFTPQVTVAGAPIDTDAEGWSLTPSDEVLEATLDFETGLVTVTGRTAGEYTLLVAYADEQAEIDLNIEITVTVEAGPVAELDVEASAPQIAAGGIVTLEVTGVDEHGNDVDLAAGDLSVDSTVVSDEFDGLSVTMTEAGARTIAVTHIDTEVTDSVDVIVAVGPLAVLDVEVSETTVDEGDAVDLEVTGVDEYGNPVELDEADLVVSSDVDTDVIDGLTVRFPTASAHVLTVTHEPSGLSTEVTVEVTAAPASPPEPEPEEEPVEAGSLPSTGAPFTWSLLPLAAGLLGLGTWLTRARRIR